MRRKNSVLQVLNYKLADTCIVKLAVMMQWYFHVMVSSQN